MKLQDRYNRTSLITTGVIFVIAGIIYFYSISAILNYQIDKDLVVEETEIFDYVKLNHRLPQVFRSLDQQIYFKEIGNQPVIRQFVDTKFCNPKEHGAEDGRKLISVVTVNGKRYEIIVIESTVETEDLIQIIFTVMLILIILLIAALFIVNRLTIKQLWKPFYRTLEEIKKFNLSGENSLKTHPAGIDEFNELNTVINGMALRVSNDYRELKTFIENASHELMTPLAVMSSKLDLLLQTEGFQSRQIELVDDIYQTVAKMTRINKAMLLLTKIENQLINQPEPLDLKELIEQTQAHLQEFILAKEIEVQMDLTHKEVTMDRSLFDVLINNLLSNAIRHNHYGGKLNIILTQTYLQVANTGRSEPLHEGHIFQRFKKSSESEGIGLGLTLIHQICENYGFRLKYNYDEPYHKFKITFPS